MATDWAADVKKHIPDADDAIIAALVEANRVLIRRPSRASVPFSDAKELAWVRENFCKKQLGLTQSDAELDAGIAAVGEQLKGVCRKGRLTVYYLVAKHFDRLDALKP